MATPQSQQTLRKISPVSKLPKLGGFAFFAIHALMIFADIMSVVMELFIAAGLGLTATLVGSIVGIPLAVIGYGGQFIVDVNAFLIAFLYYWWNHVPLMETRKLATIGVSAIIKVLPIIGGLPTATISFLVVVFIENARRRSGAIGALAGKALSK